MTDKTTPSGNAADSASAGQALRQRAESAFQKKTDLSPQQLAALSPEAVRQMLHELQVHQIELEMQNEELRRAHLELDAARERYFDLYDMAPVAYCTVSEPGLILEANFTAAALLGMARGALVGQRLTTCIFSDDQDIYYGMRQQLLTSDRPATDPPTLCELRLVKPDGKPFWAYLTASVVHQPSGVRVCRLVLHDVSERRRAEQALRESEAFSRSILKSSPDCIKILDMEGNLLSMQSGQQLLGIEDIRPFLNKSWLDFWTNRDKPAALAAVKSALAGGVGNFVGFFHAPGGQAKWWDVAISPILDANGKPARLLAVSRDVTQRQQAEAVLRQRSAQFETLVNEAPLGIYLIDADFRVRQVNPTALPAFGNIPELIGRDFAEVMHILWPETKADVVVEQFRHTLETGEACYVAEMIEQRADRQTTEYYEWQINRIPLSDGRYGVVCYFRDISERVLVQQQIVDSEARYRSLFNSIDEGFCVIDMIFDEDKNPIDYRILEVNPAFAPQTGVHDATGKRMREIAPNHDEYWFELFGKVALTGVAVRFVSEATALGGRWFDVYAFRLGGPESSKVALLFSNITERRRSEAALRERNEELVVFNRVAIGRELRMIELKQDINALCALAGQPARFALVIEEGEP